MNDALEKMKLMLIAIRKNISLMKMFLPKDKGNETTKIYKKQFEDALNMNFEE